MSSSIYLKVGGKSSLVKSFTFSGGEEHISIEDLGDKKYADLLPNVEVIARLQSSAALVQLLLISETLSRISFGSRKLTVPYFPYARQDRVTVRNESFSLEAIASLISNLGYSEVKSYDLHSGVTKKYVKNLVEVTQLEVIETFEGLHEIVAELNPIIMAPDKGAFEKSSKVASFFGRPLMHAVKIREPETGKIKRTHVPGVEFVKNQNVLMVDDICDGGATFIEIAKLLKDAGAKSVILYVTHGIFSKGYDVFNGLIDRIYTTNTFIPKELPLPGQVPLLIHKIV